MTQPSGKLYFFRILICICFLSVLLAQDKDKIKIGMIVDGSWAQNSTYLELIQNEIIELTREEFNVLFPKDKLIIGDWNPARIKSAVDKLLSDNTVDIIITPGVIASDEIARRDNLGKPVIAPFILDPEMQGIPFVKGTSGKKNLCYIHTPFTSRNTLLDFQRVVDFKHMAFLFNKHYLEKIPHLETRLRELAESVGIKFYPYTVDQSIDDIFDSFPTQIDAVYVSPLLHLSESEYDKLFTELRKRKLPSFSLLGTSEVERGLLTTNRPDIFPRIARRIALNVQRILLGEEAEEIPVHFSPGEQITINMETARQINIFPKVAVLAEAELINEEIIDSSKTLDLKQAMNEAIRVNLDLMARMKYVSAGSENIGLARSTLLPQLDLSTLGLMIDKDRAEASFGSQPEKMITGSVRLSQILYSEPAWANLSIQQSIQSSREAEYNQLRLDIALGAATAFINVLRTRNFENIQKENLKRTKSNLEISRVRESVGSAGPAEIYRWESELANNRNSVLQIVAERNRAQIQLNRILHHDLQERIFLIETNVYTDEIAKPENIFTKYLSDPRYFSAIQEFLVKESLSNSPELSALDNAINAQRRALTSATNRFWAPTFTLQADYNSILSKSGAGSEISPIFPGLPTRDDNFWNIALNLSFPLFKGTEKFVNRKQQNEKLEQLRLERQAVAEKIEQQIRSFLYTLYASFAAISQTNMASEAANKSLQVVQDGYARGLVSILDLLDAQNTALISEQLAANAVFDFILNLIATERTIGMYYLIQDQKESREYLHTFESHLLESGL